MLRHNNRFAGPDRPGRSLGGRSLQDRLRRMPIPGKRVLRPLRERLRHLTSSRQFQAYCVGTPKSGTMSVAAILSRSYRSAHQPDSRELFAVIRQRQSGLPETRLRRWVVNRDRRLWLEMDSSHLLHGIVDVLANAFPEAKFILTIRDCYSWLESEINEQLGPGSSKPPWDQAYDLRYGGSRGDKADMPLIERGLFPITAYLDYWTRHNEVVLAVPPHRLLVLRTNDISKATPQVAGFLGIPATSIDADRAHVHRRSENRIRLWELIDPGYVTGLAQVHCRHLMERFFPEIRSPEDAGLLHG